MVDYPPQKWYFGLRMLKTVFKVPANIPLDIAKTQDASRYRKNLKRNFIFRAPLNLLFNGLILESLLRLVTS